MDAYGNVHTYIYICIYNISLDNPGYISDYKCVYIYMHICIWNRTNIWYMEKEKHVVTMSKLYLWNRNNMQISTNDIPFNMGMFNVNSQREISAAWWPSKLYLHQAEKKCCPILAQTWHKQSSFSSNTHTHRNAQRYHKQPIINAGIRACHCPFSPKQLVRVREPWFAPRGAVWSSLSSRHYQLDIFGPKRYIGWVRNCKIVTLSIDSTDIIFDVPSCFNWDPFELIPSLTQDLPPLLPWTPQAYDAAPYLHGTGGTHWTHVRSSG